MRVLPCKASSTTNRIHKLYRPIHNNSCKLHSKQVTFCIFLINNCSVMYFLYTYATVLLPYCIDLTEIDVFN